MTFQELILSLQQYWAKQGCVILQPYDMEMGAGTFHTATFLRALGPEPWSAAYVQPCRRPKDGRYGENPNRLQHYYQFQVVLKPSPDAIQDLYLNSLRAIGIDVEHRDRDSLRSHDGRDGLLVLSAKEAVFKAQFPLTRKVLGFEDVSIEWTSPDDWIATARCSGFGFIFGLRSRSVGDWVVSVATLPAV